MDTKGSIEVLPSYIIDALKSREIDENEIKVSVKSDINIDNVYMDSWVFITGDRLLLMDGFVHKKKKKKGRKVADIEETWDEQKFVEYPINEFKDFKVEIMPATNIITANKNGDDFVVCKFTNTLGKKCELLQSWQTRLLKARK